MEKMMLDNHCEDFLRAYSDYLGWEARDAERIMRLLCEEYHYSENDMKNAGGSIIKIAFGWIWGRTNDYVVANCSCGLLHIKMKEAYIQVSKQNHWN